MNYWDANNDGVVNSYDGLTQEDIDGINFLCDYNGDSEVDQCEVFQCVLDYENDWRSENCPEYPELYCECPY